MTTTQHAEEWRRELVERLALSEMAREWALAGPRKGLAKRLGVTESVLRDAAKLARVHFSSGSGPVPKKVLAELHLRPVPELARPYVALAAELKMVQGHLFRSVIHAAMQTSREPTKRPGKVWGPLPGCEKYRAWLDGLYYAKHDGELVQRGHVHVTCSLGLRDAIGMRAAAYGVRKSHYTHLWLADLVDGLLVDMNLEGVEIGQTYDDAKAYVLPVLRKPKCVAPRA